MIDQQTLEHWEAESIAQIAKWDMHSELGPCNVLSAPLSATEASKQHERV